MTTTEQKLNTDSDPGNQPNVGTELAAEREWHAFRAERERRLAEPYGFLSQVALHWLDRTGPTIEGIPGHWRVEGDELVVTGTEQSLPAEQTLLADGAPVTGTVRLRVDEAKADSRFAFDTVRRIEVIRRTGRYALRILDPRTPRQRNFDGVPTFDHDRAWTVDGRWLPHPEPVTVHTDGALPGLRHELPSTGAVEFEHDGRTHRLIVTGSSVIFADAGAGDQTAEWRTVEVDIEGGLAVIDFNRAVNLPAGFSAHATCPRQPEGNELPFVVTAGERRTEVTAA